MVAGLDEDERAHDQREQQVHQHAHEGDGEARVESERLAGLPTVVGVVAKADNDAGEEEQDEQQLLQRVEPGADVVTVRILAGEAEEGGVAEVLA